MAPSNYAVIGRYILPYKIFKILKKQRPGKGGEIHITDAIRKLIEKREKFIGHIFAGKYFLIKPITNNNFHSTTFIKC